MMAAHGCHHYSRSEMQIQRIAITPSQFDPPRISLTREQQHYLSRVLRLRSGDQFIAIDAGGQWWLSSLAQQSSGEFSAIAQECLKVQNELPIAITLIAALPKGNGFDEVVRSCTELGVSIIQPISSDRTLLTPSPQKCDRWRRIIQEAAEQSERQTIPILRDPIPLKAAIVNTQDIHHRYICVARGENPHLLQCLPTSELGTGETISIAIGPEGGWTPEEVERAIAAGYQPVSLGKRILRAVTAPIVALSIIAAILD
jgi:16S rRNA (uracil1498-N3)-methyltransferase